MPRSDDNLPRIHKTDLCGVRYVYCLWDCVHVHDYVSEVSDCPFVKSSRAPSEVFLAIKNARKPFIEVLNKEVLYCFFFSASVARRLADDSFALIFGINTFLALIFQSIFTLVVVSDTGFTLTPRYQYVVNGSYFLTLAVLYLVMVILSKMCRRRSSKNYE